MSDQVVARKSYRNQRRVSFRLLATTPTNPNVGDKIKLTRGSVWRTCVRYEVLVLQSVDIELQAAAAAPVRTPAGYFSSLFDCSAMRFSVTLFSCPALAEQGFRHLGTRCTIKLP